MQTEHPIESSTPKPVLKQALPQAATPPARRSGWGRKLLLLAVVAGVGAGLYVYLKPAATSKDTTVQTVPTVAAAKVVRANVYEEVPIPAEFRPYVESELHAMVTGYVKNINVDFGDKVKAGQVLAILEVPELTDELNSAQAKQEQAVADYANAHLIYTRLVEVNQQHPKLVAQQDIDTALSKDSNSAAAIAAAKADVAKYQALLDYTKITAPFDGVITRRFVDPGALVQAGTSSDRSMPLVRVSDNYHLRLDFPVSVDYVQDVKVGQPVTVRVDSLGGKTYTGKIVRFADSVNDETRTMETEMEVENPDLEIVPGMYAVAMFKFNQHSGALTIPTQAVINPKDPTVNVINADNQIEARPVKLGVEMPDKYEVVSGLREGELVMVGNASQAHAGEKVEPKIVDEPTIP
jgi:RND family efflux transporter MFP subunit